MKRQEVNINDFVSAIQRSDFDKVKDFVLKEGADINAFDNLRVPFFVHAIYSQNAQIIDFFLEQGAKVNPESQGRIDVTPLGAACAIAAKADSTQNINYTFGKLIDLGADLNPTNCFSSPLTEVIKVNGACSGVMVQYLIKLGANINPVADYTLPPLSAATQLAVSAGELDMFSLCLSLGAKVNPDNVTQKSPLTAAIEKGGPNTKIIVNFLLDKGATIYSETMKSYESPIHQAALNNQKEIIEILVSRNAETNNKIDMSSVLKYAVDTHCFDMGEFILSRYAKDIIVSKDLFKQCMNNKQSKLLELSIANGFDYSEECALTIKKSDSKIIQAVINKYGVYPPAEHPQFKYGEFVIRTLDPHYFNESDRPDNTLNKKVTCRLSIKDGLIYDKDNELFVTTKLNPTTQLEYIYLWVLDRHGELFSATMRGEVSGDEIGNQHSFFSKKDGFGKPVACGGHFKVEAGKIVEIDASSGHYKPSKDQLILAIKFLHKQGVLADKIDIKYFDIGSERLVSLQLEEVLNISPEIILSKYQALEGYSLSTIKAIENNSSVDMHIINPINHTDDVQLFGQEGHFDNDF